MGGCRLNKCQQGTKGNSFYDWPIVEMRIVEPYEAQEG